MLSMFMNVGGLVLLLKFMPELGDKAQKAPGTGVEGACVLFCQWIFYCSCLVRCLFFSSFSVVYPIVMIVLLPDPSIHRVHADLASFGDEALMSLCVWLIQVVMGIELKTTHSQAQPLSREDASILEVCRRAMIGASESALPAAPAPAPALPLHLHLHLLLLPLLLLLLLPELISLHLLPSPPLFLPL